VRKTKVQAIKKKRQRQRERESKLWQHFIVHQPVTNVRLYECVCCCCHCSACTHI